MEGMSLLDRARNSLAVDTSRRDGDRDWRELAIAAGYGAIGAVSLALVLAIPVVIAWLTDPHGGTTWLDALSFGGDAWALAHRAHLGAPGGYSVVFAPLVLTLAALALARAAAKAMLWHLSGQSGAWWEAPAAYVGGYLVGGLGISALAMTGPAAPNLLTVVPGAVLVGLAGCWLALAHRDHPVAERARTAVTEQASMSTKRALRPAVEGLLGYLGIGAVLLIGLIAFHLSDIGKLNGQLAPGLFGGIVLWIGQVAALPNLMLWCAAWTTGAQVDIGSVQIGSDHVHGGLLPLIPMLGATPSAGSLPGWAAFAPILPVLLGAFIGRRSVDRLTTYTPLRVKALTAVQAALLTAVFAVVVTWLSTAGVSGGTLSYIGPSLMVAPLLAIELLLGALLSVLVLHWRRALRR